MIYLDNAATGGFKPSAVISSAENVMRYLLANPTRSSHRLSLTGAEIVYNTRKMGAEYFGTSPERVIFTKNCTEALNLAIFGCNYSGGTVITTIYEHNSVLRPLYSLKKRGKINLVILNPEKKEDLARLVSENLNEKVKLIAITAVSNVTGEVMPFREIAKIAKKTKTPVLVDGAQGGGHLSFNLKKDGISYLCLAGHKGLYGIMGSGMLLINPESDLSPVFFGGTGTESLSLDQPSCLPEKLESGTLNLPAIAALSEGLKYSESNRKTFSEILFSWTEKVIKNLSSIKNVRVYSPANPVGIVSFKIDGIPSGEVADILNDEFDIAVRAGLHCSPLIHKKLNTEEDGLIRASFSVQNTERELAEFLRAVSLIAKR